MKDLLEEAKKGLEKARKVVTNMCNGDGKWLMTIPANENTDSDIIISDALNYIELLCSKVVGHEVVLKWSNEQIESLTKDREELKNLLDNYGLRERFNCADIKRRFKTYEENLKRDLNLGDLKSLIAKLEDENHSLQVQHDHLLKVNMRYVDDFKDLTKALEAQRPGWCPICHERIYNEVNKKLADLTKERDELFRKFKYASKSFQESDKAFHANERIIEELEAENAELKKKINKMEWQMQQRPVDE